MPISTRDEILVKYAELMQPELTKFAAWDWRDLVSSFGLDAAFGAAVPDGIC